MTDTDNNTDKITVISRRSSTQARGRARREKLLQAAADLLAEKELEEISFNEIALRAEIPKGSAYHFYDNVSDIYSALTQNIGADLFECLQQPIEDQPISRWEEMVDAVCDRAVEFYASRPDARQLLIGGKTPPQFKRSDRENDRRLGQLIKHHLEQYFTVPEIPNATDVYFYMVEIIDLMYCLSMIRHNEITPEMAKEAKRAGIAYLRSYLPAELASKETNP